MPNRPLRAVAALSLAFVAGAPLHADEFAYIAFKTPSGNIICALFDDDDPAARCDMSELTPSYTTPPPDCDLDWGSSFWIGAREDKGALACVSDPVVASPAEAVLLPYGASISFAGITCMSEKTGVTCINAAGHGFSIAKARQRLY